MVMFSDYGVANSISERAKEAYIKLVDFVENDVIPAEPLCGYSSIARAESKAKRGQGEGEELG